MGPNDSCLIWQTPAEKISTVREGVEIDSPRTGGLYFVALNAASRIHNFDAPAKILLTSWLVEQRNAGNSCPEITIGILGDIAKKHPPSVQHRAYNLLCYLARKSQVLGAVVEFNVPYENSQGAVSDKVTIVKTTYELLAWTASLKMSDIVWLARSCDKEDWITCRGDHRIGETVYKLEIKFNGYKQLSRVFGEPGHPKSIPAVPPGEVDPPNGKK